MKYYGIDYSEELQTNSAHKDEINSMSQNKGKRKKNAKTKKEEKKKKKKKKREKKT